MISPFILGRAKVMAKACGAVDWDVINLTSRTRFIAITEALFADMTAKGWKVMGREPTEKMIDAATAADAEYGGLTRRLFIQDFGCAFDAAPAWPGEK